LKQKFLQRHQRTMNDTTPHHPLRTPCSVCGSELGYVITKNGQDCVYCQSCKKHQYNAPKTETGRKPRTVSTVHQGIRPKKRARILFRASGRCELCGSRNILHVGHILSVKSGLRLGLTESVLNDDENLCAMCEECNLGIGDATVPLRLAVGILRSRKDVGEHEIKST
jgi:hypothetical protein